MYKVKATNPDVKFKLNLDFTNSEGDPVDSVDDAIVEITSDDPSAVTVTIDPADQAAGTLHFGKAGGDGKPKTVNVTARITSKSNPDLLGIIDTAFIVTSGDPANISLGTMTIEGLTEEVPAEPTPGV